MSRPSMITPPLAPIAWESHLPHPAGADQRRVRELEYRLLGEDDDRATLRIVKAPMEWVMDGVAGGVGMAEYHDLMENGRPAGLDE